MDLAWQEGRLHFQTAWLGGTLVADGRRQLLTELVYRPTGERLDHPRIGMMLALYRLLCRGGWLGEARVMAHRARPTAEGVEVEWAPRLGHPVQLTARFRIQEPGIIDCHLTVLGHAYLPAYEVFLSNYFAPGFRGGAYVQPVRWEAVDGPVVVRPEASPVYRGLYVAFPRDEAAAHCLTDGRWQRGRHFTRFLGARYYALPLGFYGQVGGPVDIVVMGLPRDVFAVSMAYATADPSDSVGQHNSLYLSLFGRDLHPGERWQTVVRLVVGPFGQDPEQHRALYAAFLQAYQNLPAVLEVDDPQQLPGLAG